jgi:hypothetical protein
MLLVHSRNHEDISVQDMCFNFEMDSIHKREEISEMASNPVKPLLTKMIYVEGSLYNVPTETVYRNVVQFCSEWICPGVSKTMRN